VILEQVHAQPSLFLLVISSSLDGHSASLEVHLGPAQGAGFLGADAAEHAHGDVRPQARSLGCIQVAGQRAEAEKSVSVLSQIAWMTWAGVSSCGECPVSGSSRNRAAGIAAA
jgi:hypothetical protein